MFLLQTVVLSSIHLFGAVPSIIISFIICVMMLENEFRTAVTISAICAVIMGAVGSRNFTLVTLSYVYCGIIAFSLRKKPKYVGNYAKTLFWTFVTSLLTEIMILSVAERNFTSDMFLLDALPTSVFNICLSALLYPILKKTLYKEEKKKRLLID